MESVEVFRKDKKNIFILFWIPNPFLGGELCDTLISMTMLIFHYVFIIFHILSEKIFSSLHDFFSCFWSSSKLGWEREKIKKYFRLKKYFFVKVLLRQMMYVKKISCHTFLALKHPILRLQLQLFFTEDGKKLLFFFGVMRKRKSREGVIKIYFPPSQHDSTFELWWSCNFMTFFFLSFDFHLHLFIFLFLSLCVSVEHELCTPVCAKRNDLFW